MVAKKSKSEPSEIQVIKISRERVRIRIVGTEPLIMHRLSEKARKELLLPPPKKSRADKASKLKHDPYQEYRDCAYVSEDPDAPTLLQMPSMAFKDALRSAAVDIPGGSSKAQLGRLTYVENDYVPIWGVPKLHLTIVRQKDMNRTPTVRSRIIIPEWCAELSVIYTVPILNLEAIVNLFGAAGIIIGVGDFRAEKGKGNAGSWELVDEKNAEFKKIVKQGGRRAQMDAMIDTECYDKETRDLLAWFDDEAERRGFTTMKQEEELRQTA